eukprot:TRINITY_DN4080_c0_g1_i1.p1 TRINITY_DN4080_c0_g1~~TRINITY_DN4080_c0_g1_i1.p1  ORF type:complete len:326 (+),score=83.34 TRINITY_DN4080_c0_g1_i1:245-1222(+)
MRTLLLQCLVVAFLVASCHAYLPVVMVHGIDATYKSMDPVADWIDEAYPGTYVLSVKVGDGRLDSFVWPMQKQLEEVCTAVCADPELAEGFNLIGYSQGALLSRAYIQTGCCAYPVHNFISWVGPHGGIFGVPFVNRFTPPELLNKIAGADFYDDVIQDTISFAQYWRDPYRLDDYLEKSKFLADLNNERADKNYTYVERLRSLHHLVLVRSSIDEVIVPSEAEWFGQFNVSQSGELITLAMNETQMYKEDWLGLRDMNENSQVHLFEVACLHQDFPTDACKQFFNETTMPYLDDVCQSFGVKNYDTYYDWEKNFDHQFEEEQEE